MAGLIRQFLESHKKPALEPGERYCPDCHGTRRTLWNIPAYPLRCQRCEGTGKIRPGNS